MTAPALVDASTGTASTFPAVDLVEGDVISVTAEPDDPNSQCTFVSGPRVARADRRFRDLSDDERRTASHSLHDHT